jgi:hypothetical protein
VQDTVDDFLGGTGQGVSARIALLAPSLLPLCVRQAHAVRCEAGYLIVINTSLYSRERELCFSTQMAQTERDDFS